jgi:hypothetical protein
MSAEDIANLFETEEIKKALTAEPPNPSTNPVAVVYESEATRMLLYKGGRKIEETNPL